MPVITAFEQRKTHIKDCAIYAKSIQKQTVKYVDYQLALLDNAPLGPMGLRRS